MAKLSISIWPYTQDDALRAAGCEKLFTDTASGASTTRPRLEAALAYLRPGDTLCVWKLDRLGRCLRPLIEVVNDLHRRQISFRSLQEAMDPGRPTHFHVFGALAEFELVFRT